METFSRITTVLKSAVDKLVAKDYQALADETGMTADRLSYIVAGVEEYGRTLIEIPQDFYRRIEPGLVDNWSDESKECWAIDLDLWTVEEGHSDLTLTGYVYLTREKDYLQIEDLHVL